MKRLVEALAVIVAAGFAGCQTSEVSRPSVEHASLPPNAYIVQAGDALSSIARSHGVSARDIMAFNKLGTAPLRVGQVILMPPTKLAAGSATPAVVSLPAPTPGIQPPPPPRKTLPKPEFKPIALPPATWAPENLALAALTSSALTPAECASLTEVLQNALVETRYFRVRSRSDIDAVLKEQSFQQKQASDDAAYLVEMGKLLATRKIVGGTVGKLGDTYAVTVRMVNVETGEIEISEQRQMTADADYLIDLVREGGRLLALKHWELKQAKTPVLSSP
jgi:LysM repeat protein